jgi:hypothetical protein
MKWIEMIRLRGAAENMDVLKPLAMEKISSLCADFTGSMGLLAEHLEYDGDLAVVVLRDEQNSRPQKSREGFLLAEFLAEYGSVDHAIWVVVGSAESPSAPEKLGDS